MLNETKLDFMPGFNLTKPDESESVIIEEPIKNWQKWFRIISATTLLLIIAINLGIIIAEANNCGGFLTASLVLLNVLFLIFVIHLFSVLCGFHKFIKQLDIILISLIIVVCIIVTTVLFSTKCDSLSMVILASCVIIFGTMLIYCGIVYVCFNILKKRGCFN